MRLLALLLLATTTHAAPLIPSRSIPVLSPCYSRAIPDPLAGELQRWPDPRTTEAVLSWGCDHLEINAAAFPTQRQALVALRDETMRRLQPWVYLREAQFREGSLVGTSDRADSVIWRFYARRRKVALGVWYGAYDSSLAGRRAALERLRDALGVDAYREARLPCPACIEAFTKIE